MPRIEPPWWLKPGTEICPFCEVHFQFEAAGFCSVCDRIICQLCSFEDVETRQLYCPDCVPLSETP